MPASGGVVRKRPESRAATVVARAVLVLLSMSIAGCIIPTPLEQQTAPVNAPPKILTEEVMPTYGVPFTRTTNQLFPFYVAASDADLGDTLTARLLFGLVDQGSAAAHTQDEITLVASQSDDPTVRTGFIPNGDGRAYCALLSGKTDVYLAVSDHGFKPGQDGDATIDNDSDLDEIEWVMTCGN